MSLQRESFEKHCRVKHGNATGQGRLDEGWTEGVSRTQALKMYGNAVVATQAVEAFLRLKEAR